VWRMKKFHVDTSQEHPCPPDNKEDTLLDHSGTLREKSAKRLNFKNKHSQKEREPMIVTFLMIYHDITSPWNKSRNATSLTPSPETETKHGNPNNSPNLTTNFPSPYLPQAAFPSSPLASPSNLQIQLKAPSQSSHTASPSDKLSN
jgi:hypothetical protein